MIIEESTIECQVPNINRMGDEATDTPRPSLMRRLKLAIRRRMSPKRERAFKKGTNNLLNRVARLTGGTERPTAPPAAGATPPLQAGDLVRVRTEEEIRATLNHWRQLKGCTFMPEMAPYCGTTQTVHRRMTRFVDERDLRVKKVSGIVLLEGLECQGTAAFGPCDRSCYYFWREEWLEKVD